MTYALAQHAEFDGALVEHTAHQCPLPERIERVVIIDRDQRVAVLYADSISDRILLDGIECKTSVCVAS
jgi:hypothetical protein